MNLHDSAEKLSFKQIAVVSLLVAVIGLSFGFFSGQFFKSNAPKIPAPQANPVVTTYSGRLFPVDGTNQTYTHKLTDASGNVSAYLQADDDKLKVILPTTEVTVTSDVLRKENGIPVVRVKTIKF